MSGAALVSMTVVVVSLCAIGAIDAKRKTISLAWLGCLLVGGMAWLTLGGGLELVGAGWSMHGLGVLVGAGVPALLIGAAELLGRRWPIYPGDALLMGAIGMILGLRTFLWALALGAILAMVHRVCLQLRRGRPVLAGYLAAGPGLAGGTVAVFLALNAGAAFAEKKPDALASGAAPIEATELLPVKSNLPEALAEREVLLTVPSALPFGDLVARIADAAGISVAVEERPSRVSDGEVTLPEPPPLLPGDETRLVALLDDVGSRAGYAWEWRGERVVFYRYWDRAWSGVESEAVAEKPQDAVERLLSWLGRVFGSGDAADAESGGAPEPKGEVATAAVPGQSEKAKGSGDLAGTTGAESGQETKAADRGKVGPGGTDVAEAVTPAAPEEEKPPVWIVDPEGQKTLRGVLEAWATQAEWKVAWQARQDFSVGAGATFEGEFLEAVDRLLSDPKVARLLAVRAHANRYLVVTEAGQ